MLKISRMAQWPLVGLAEELSLAHIPTEIVGYIASIACTDGGPTGCALSLVSRYIADAASPYRLQSVLLASVRSAQQFYDGIAELPPQRRRVQDLCLIFNGQSDAEVTVLEHGEELSQTSREVLTLLAPSLETFTCIVFGIVDDNLPQQLLSHPFSSLTKLTLRLFLPLRARAADVVICMPRLQHLIYTVSSLPNWQELPSAFISACPTIVNLEMMEIPIIIAVFLSFVVSGSDPSMFMPWLHLPLHAFVMPAARMFYASPKYDAFRTPRDFHTRIEAFGIDPIVGAESSHLAHRSGLAHRVSRRTAQEWKDSWLSGSGPLSEPRASARLFEHEAGGTVD